MTLRADAPRTLPPMVKRVISALDGKKAADIVTIDLRGKSDIADFMVIASGTSAAHNRALSDIAEETLRAHGASLLSVEGKSEGNWVIVDTPDVVLHIFRPETRRYYGLERMWQADFSQADALHDVLSLTEGMAESAPRPERRLAAKDITPSMRVFRPMAPA